jgi:hypothetical protein
MNLLNACPKQTFKKKLKANNSQEKTSISIQFFNKLLKILHN